MILIVLKTGLSPSASGSAYLELEPASFTTSSVGYLTKPSSALKLSCTVHGPRPLPRSASFTPQVLLSTHVKFAPFASRLRRAYVRDAGERDLAVHLETALRGMIIGERWPKSGLDVIITVLEADGDRSIAKDNIKTGENSRSEGWAIMAILSGCITVASAAIADAGIDCIDLVTGGMSAIVCQPPTGDTITKAKPREALPQLTKSMMVVKDPCSIEHEEILAACVVGYLQSRDEITAIWSKGDVTDPVNELAHDNPVLDSLVDQAIDVAMATRLVLLEAVKESTKLKLQRSKQTQT